MSKFILSLIVINFYTFIYSDRVFYYDNYLNLYIKSELNKNHTNCPFYESAVNYISTNSEIKNGFLFLLSKERKIPKRFYQNGRIKCKVSNFLYDLVDESGAHPVKNEIETNDDAVEHCQPSTLSTCDSNYRFVVFFSKIKNNQFECKIVNYTKHGDHDGFYLKTRFGKVLNINFCIDNGNVSFVKMRTYHAN